MKTVLLAFVTLFALPATSATLEYTYGAEDIVIAFEEINNRDCEVASCGAYSYYASLRSVEALVSSTCKNRGFKTSEVLDTETKDGVVTMTALCKK